MQLRDPPHCLNCHNLKEKRAGYHCKPAWGGKMLPEQAGHLKQKISKAVSLYEITCSHYTPKQHIRA
jgi:hypothetical protein